MCKDSANRGQNKTNSFVFYAEVPPFLWKDSESREQNKKWACTFFCCAETQPVLSKDSARWCVFCLHILMKEYKFA